MSESESQYVEFGANYSCKVENLGDAEEWFLEIIQFLRSEINTLGYQLDRWKFSSCNISRHSGEEKKISIKLFTKIKVAEWGDKMEKDKGFFGKQYREHKLIMEQRMERDPISGGCTVGFCGHDNISLIYTNHDHCCYKIEK